MYSRLIFKMSDSDSIPKPLLPSQTAMDDQSASKPPEPAGETASTPGPATADLLDQARKWLASPEIRRSDGEKKVAFLRSKGLSAGDIETLLFEGVDATVTSDEVCGHAPAPVRAAQVVLAQRRHR